MAKRHQTIKCKLYELLIVVCTGVDFSKILGGQTKILGGKGGKSQKCMGVSQLLGGHVPGSSPKVYAYGHLESPTTLMTQLY